MQSFPLPSPISSGVVKSYEVFRVYYLMSLDFTLTSYLVRGRSFLNAIPPTPPPCRQLATLLTHKVPFEFTLGSLVPSQQGIRAAGTFGPQCKVTAVDSKVDAPAESGSRWACRQLGFFFFITPEPRFE